MIKSRLIEVLKTFSKKEFREFKKWLDSPMHNQREDVITLYDYLLTNSNLFKEDALKKEAAFKYIFPKENFDDAKMRQVMHFLFKNIEEYLAYSNFIKDQLNKKIALAQIYRKRKLDKNFLKSTKEISRELEAPETQNERQLFKKYDLQKEIFEFQSTLRRSQDLNLQLLTDTFDELYISVKLRHGCLINSHKMVYKVEYNEGFIKDILSYIESNNLLENLRIGIYFYLYKITSESSKEEDFFILKDYLKKSNNFTKTELREVYLFAINFCATQINSGNKIFIKEAFFFYKNGIEKEIFIENNILSRFTFKNAIAVALKLKEFEWVENFIEKYNQYLEEKYRESFLNINYAQLYYATNNYDKALEVIQKYEFNDLIINLNAKTMLLKIYYELDEFKVLESLLESMRAYVQRKKVSGYQKALYKNIVKYTKKLIKVNPYNKAQKEKLKVEIEATKPLTEKTWLLKQLAEL